MQAVTYTHQVRLLMGFAARVRTGIYGRGRHVQSCTVNGALTAIGQEIALACGSNPTKLTGGDKLIPRLQQTYDGWRKEDPPMLKQLPVEADVPKLITRKGLEPGASELDRVVGDMTLIAFYYLL